MSAPDLAICADRDHDWYCTKAHGHLGEHATITVSGVTRHRWTQTTPGDAVTDRAPASSGAPSLVELDRREAADAALAALVEWRKATKAAGVREHIHATVALRKAADAYIAAVQS